MDLDLDAAARLLRAPPETVSQWVREGVLPAHHVDGRPRFDRAELCAWATARRHAAAPELFGPASPESLPGLSGALARGGIYRDVPGASFESVLLSVTRLAGIPPSVDRKKLHELLLGREALASTGLGEGVAVPHPRDPSLVKVAEPTVLLCFLAQAVEWRAVDQRPVQVLFTLLSPSTRAHLETLARIAFGLRDEKLRALLDERAPDEQIHARVVEVDRAGARR
jgi:PTS system nitrogen regulatory IIA component